MPRSTQRNEPVGPRETPRLIEGELADAADGSTRIRHVSHPMQELSREEKRELVESLSPEDRKALAELAKKG